MKHVKRQSFRLFTAVLLIVALFSTGAVSAAEPTKSFETMDDRLEYMRLMVEFVKGNYKYEISDEELMDAAYNGLFDALDDYSDYFTAEEYENFNLQARGEYGGIGIQVTKRGEETVVIAPLEGTPGQRAGIRSGDIIKTVDGETITGYSLDKAVALMRGEPGTKVVLGILRKNRPEIIEFDIIREVIVIKEMDWEMLERGIGYIRIAKFSEDTDKNLGNALFELQQKDAEAFIIDLRNNPGGIVDEVLPAADRFIEAGRPILHVDYRGEGNRKTYTAETDPLGAPLVVLIDGGSASAAEIFAGSVKDTGAGVVIGTTSFGKGTVQSVIPITNGGAVKLTTAEYLTASENKIDGIGIEPDIVVTNPEKEDLAEALSFVPMIEAEKPGPGDSGLNVYGAQQRLAFLGYGVKATGVVDAATFEAVKAFQTEEGLYPYGVLDWSTRDALNARIDDILHRGSEDYQLKRAVEHLREAIQ